MTNKRKLKTAAGLDDNHNVNLMPVWTIGEAKPLWDLIVAAITEAGDLSVKLDHQSLVAEYRTMVPNDRHTDEQFDHRIGSFRKKIRRRLGGMAYKQLGEMRRQLSAVLSTKDLDGEES